MSSWLLSRTCGTAACCVTSSSRCAACKATVHDAHQLAITAQQQGRRDHQRHPQLPLCSVVCSGSSAALLVLLQRMLHMHAPAVCCANLHLLCHDLQDWKQTLWNDIKTDQMEEGAKNFVKEVKALPKRVRR